MIDHLIYVNGRVVNRDINYFEKENCKIFLTVNKNLLFNKTVTK